MLLGYTFVIFIFVYFKEILLARIIRYVSFKDLRMYQDKTQAITLFFVESPQKLHKILSDLLYFSLQLYGTYTDELRGKVLDPYGHTYTNPTRPLVIFCQLNVSSSSTALVT